MQATPCFSPTPSPFGPAKNLSAHVNPFPKLAASLSSQGSSIKGTAVAYETSIVDCSSAFSVFPAEACKTIWGDSCFTDTYPEAQLKPEARITSIASELFDGKYLQYINLKNSNIVLRGEACDVLGGEFCKCPYKRGIY